MINRRNTRLTPDHYAGRQTYFITICCDRRALYLEPPATARRVVTLLLDCASRHSFALPAFCRMPDHLHILAEGTQDHCDLLEFIRFFKQRTAFDFRKSRALRLWEMSYYDRILGPSDSIEQLATYIWWNPVRKHLCPHPGDHPFSGSQTIPWLRPAAPSADP
jgi:REP element-mobilizing transposase RayT